MTYLLAISVGPVQEFIAAARHTRDLWYGSTLLSDISRAVAKSVQDQGGKLIFPAPESPADLEPDSDFTVANVILAELSDSDPKMVACLAKKAAKDDWKQEAETVLHRYPEFIHRVTWDSQVNDVIEFYAAWIPLGDDYQGARRQVMRLLDGRKHGRDFDPAKGKERERIPKSSLDGLRESVLTDPRGWPEGKRRLRLQQGEQLDVVGLVKRTGGGKQQYPSVACVTADPWIRGLIEAHGPDVLNPLILTCEYLGPDKIHTLDTSDRGQPHYSAFPFEGTVVYRSRHLDLLKEAALEPEDIEPLVARLADLTKLAGEPSPYLAVLVADGDRMGRVLAKVAKIEDHQHLSRQLSRFASEARVIVNQHSGVPVYAGGDDVLAFLPTDLALKCARQLHDVFGELMKPWPDETGKPLTLSVGLAIAHFMENLEDLLKYGRDAEKHAKKPRVEDGSQNERDGLSVHVIKRGGGPVEMRANWTSDPNPEDWLTKLADLLDSGAIPGKVAYDLHRVADVYENWRDENQVEVAIRCDALRIIKAKQPRESGGRETIRELLPKRISNAASLRFADELLVARQIAWAIRQSNGRNGKEAAS